MNDFEMAQREQVLYQLRTRFKTARDLTRFGVILRDAAATGDRSAVRLHKAWCEFLKATGPAGQHFQVDV